MRSRTSSPISASSTRTDRRSRRWIRVAYLDLAKMVVPDLDLADGSPQGQSVIDLRHIGGPDRESDPPETIDLPLIATVPVRSDGRNRLLMLLDLGQMSESAEGFAALALYDLAAAPSLIDAVSQYRWDEAASRFVPDSDAFEVLSKENETRF